MRDGWWKGWRELNLRQNFTILPDAPKVGDAQVPRGVQDEVLRLQVAVDDAARVHVVKRGGDLGCVEARTLLAEAAALGEVVVQLAAVEVVKDHVELAAKGGWGCKLM